MFWSVLFGNQQTCYRDESHFHYPLFKYIQTELEAGQFPLWTPYDNIGQPFFANASLGILVTVYFNTLSFITIIEKFSQNPYFYKLP
jgi:hypothetical protein